MEKDENPNLTIESIKRIKSRIEHGIDNAEDYELLDYFLSSIGHEKYILNNFQKYDIYSYSDFIDEKSLLEKKKMRKNWEDSADRHLIVFGTLRGMINACVEHLEDYIKKPFRNLENYIKKL